MKTKRLLLSLLLALMVPLTVHAQTVIYSENFDSYTVSGTSPVLPTGWTSTTTGTGAVASVMKNISGSVHAYSAPNYFIMGNAQQLTQNASVSVVLPTFDMPTNCVKLRFKVKSSRANMGNNTLTVRYTYHDFSGNHTVTFLTCSASTTYSEQSVSFNLSTVPSNATIVLVYLGRSGASAQTYWYIDDLIVENDLKAPTNLTATNITGTTASLTWTLNGNGGSAQVWYSTQSDFSNYQTSTTGNLTGLLGYTTYYAKVRARVRSNATSPWYYGPWSDPISFTTQCATPTNLYVYSDPGLGGMVATWEGNASSYHLEYDNVETFQTAYDGIVYPNGNSYTFTDQQIVPGMKYRFRIKSQCDPSTTSEWSDWVEFTNCPTYMNLPLHANFDYMPVSPSNTENNLPGCWTRINSSADPNYKNYPCVENNQSLCHSNYYPQGLYNYIRFNIPENGPDQYLVLAPVDPVNDVTISFWVRSASSETSYSYNIGLMHNNYSTDDFYVKDGYNFGGSNTDYIQNTYTFTAQEMASNGNYIVIWARSSNAASSFCIDDIDIYPANYHCGEPVNVHADNIGLNSAQIVWENPVSGGGEWSVRYKKATDEDWIYKYDGGLVSLGCDLDNLESNTTYTVAVRDNCNDIDHSEWVEATFTTLDVIPVPTNLHVFTDYLGNQHVGSSWVDLAWDCTPVEGQSEVDRYGLEVSDNGENWYGLAENAYWSSFANHCIIGPISPGTHYVRVRVINVDGNVVTEGNWSESLQFNIEECDEVVIIRPEDPFETYDFNSSTLLPDCWTVYGDTPYGVSIKDDALDFDVRRNVEEKYVQLEEFLVTDDYGGLVVTFDWRHLIKDSNNTTNATVQLQYQGVTEGGYWQDAGEPISLFKDMEGTQTWEIVNYTRYIPYDYFTRLRLKYTITDYQQFSYGQFVSCYIDNLVVTGREYCNNPSELSIEPATYGGRVIWDKVDAAQSYDINYQVEGAVEWITIEGVEGYEYDDDHLFYDLTGLQANTTYRVNMKSECSNQWPTDFVTFTTSDFGSFNELMYTFEEGMPADFSVSGAGAANVSVSTEQSFGADPHSLKYDFVSGSPYPSQALAYVEIGNCLNTREFNDFLVYFDMYCTDVANTYETVYLQYKAFGSDGWEEDWRSAGTWYNSYDSKGWVERHGTFSIPNELQGIVSKLRFRLVFTDHGSGENTYIDNIRLFPKGSCNNVSGIDIVAQESTSATFRWNDPNYEAGTTQSVGFTIRYRNLTIPTNTNTGWNEIPVWVDASNPTRQYSITLNELDPSSYYVYDIRTLCSDGGYTVWSSQHQHFVTDCQPYELNDMEPFVEDFNDIDLACWTYNTRWGRVYDGHGGSNWSLRSNKLDVSGWNDYIDTPEIELNGNYVSKGSSYLVLRFWTKCSGVDGTGNKVRVLVGNQEVEIFEMPASGCDQWQQIDLSLSRWLPDNGESTNTIKVRFDHESTATAEWFIDDVVITSWDEANYGTRVFDDAVSNDMDWTKDYNWYPDGAPTYSPSMNVTLMGMAWVPENCSSTVGTMRFGTKGYLDAQPGSNLTITEVDIPENKVLVEQGATLNIGTAHFGFDKIFTNQEGTYNITNLNVDGQWLVFNSGDVLLNTVNLTTPGHVSVTQNTWGATLVNSSGLFEVYPNSVVTIGTFNAEEVYPLGFLIEGIANITTLNANGGNAVLVKDGGLLNASTINGTSSGANDRILILDGGQVKTENVFYGTIEKNITGYGAENVNRRTRWNLIATPTEVMAVQTLVPKIGSDYLFDQMDIYRFNGGNELEWDNFKCPFEGGCDSPFGTIPQGQFSAEMGLPLKGYLYALQEDATIQFVAGPVGNEPFRATNVDTDVNLTCYTNPDDVSLNGWNLIGNPYTCNAYLKQGGNYIPFYRMNDTGDAIVGVPAGTPIKPCEAVFVSCTVPSSTVTFTTTEPAGLDNAPEDPMIQLPTHVLYEDQDASMPTTVTQTLSLSAGVNWVSFYVETTLDDLKTALQSVLSNAPGIKITSQNNGYTIWNGSSWRGSLNSIDVIQMYVVEVPSACMFSLEALPINPAAHPITIVNGINWIGFPFSASMSVTDAFDEFAENGDKVSSLNNGSATYQGSWSGGLSSLQPGQGYKLEVTTTFPRTFTFSTGTKKAKPFDPMGK